MIVVLLGRIFQFTDLYLSSVDLLFLTDSLDNALRYVIVMKYEIREFERSILYFELMK